MREQGQRVRTGTGVLEHHDVAVLGGLVPGSARGFTEPVGQPVLDVREPLPQQREVVARGLLLRVAHQVVHEFGAARVEPAVQRGDVDAVDRGRRRHGAHRSAPASAAMRSSPIAAPASSSPMCATSRSRPGVGMPCRAAVASTGR